MLQNKKEGGGDDVELISEFTRVIQALMTMDLYLGKYKYARLYSICYMRTHILCIPVKHFMLLSWLDFTLC